MKSSVVGIAVGAVFLAVGLLASIGSWMARSYDVEIQEHGGRALAHVSDKHASQPDDWGIDYWFVLPDGRRIDVRHRGISQGLWMRLQIGASIEVCYKLDNPVRNFPVGEGNTPTKPAIFVSAIGAVLAIFGAFLMFGSAQSIFKSNIRALDTNFHI